MRKSKTFRPPVFALFSILSVFTVPQGTDLFAATVPEKPIATLYATQGLSQTASAQTMGEGRLTFNITGSWYRQEAAMPLAPDTGADIITGAGAASFGVNNFFDIFASVSGFGLLNSTMPVTSGLGTIAAGAQGSLPLPPSSPLAMGAQLMVLAGSAADQINGNRADGYNYFETRVGYDFLGKFLQTIIFGGENHVFKFHANEGIDFSLEKDKDYLFLLAAGFQGSLNPFFTFGLELNSRSFIKSYTPRTDPLWITPSLQFQAPKVLNLLVGADISLSRDRAAPGAERALEQYRIFSSLALSFDLLASKRENRLAREREAGRLKTELDSQKRESQRVTDSLARKAREDSAALALQGERERLRADSLARKLTQDSLALIEAEKASREAERANRTEAEKQFLATGYLLLDAVSFESGKTVLAKSARTYLGLVANMIKKYPALRIEVAGHTDNSGKQSSNMVISQGRAEAVSAFMIQSAPELGAMLSAKGYGSTMPQASNKSAQGRKANRRIELRVQNMDALKEYNP